MTMPRSPTPGHTAGRDGRGNTHTPPVSATRDAKLRDGESEAPALIDSLVALGLTLNQSRLYLSLLQAGSASALQLAGLSGVPRTRVYEALEALERAGFCTTRADRVAMYEPVAPEIALSEWRERREQERRLRSEREDQLRDLLIEQLPRLETSEPAHRVPFMEALVGSDRVSDVFEEMVAAAGRRLDIVQAAPVFQPRERWNVAEAEAVARGVHVRVLFTDSVVADPARYEGLLAAGGEARVSSGLILKLVVRDGVDAMVAVPDTSAGQSEYAVIRITHPDLVAPLQLLFQKEWRRGTPLDAR